MTVILLVKQCLGPWLGFKMAEKNYWVKIRQQDGKKEDTHTKKKQSRMPGERAKEQKGSEGKLILSVFQWRKSILKNKNVQG